MKVTRNRRRTTKWNLFFHYASIALAIISGVVLMPLYLRFIPLDLYGAWLATGNILAWLTVIDPGLSTVLQQQASTAYGKGDVVELNALLTGGVIISGAISLLVLVAGIASSSFLIDWLNLSAISDKALVKQVFVIAVAGNALMMFSYGLTAFNQGLQSSLGIGLVFVITMIIGLALTVALLYKGMGLLALPIGLVVRGIGLTVGVAGYLLWRYRDEKMLHYRFSIQGIATLAKLTSYTFLGRIAGVFANNMDAFVITRYLGVEVAPVFVLTRKAPDISRLFLERPAVAFMPAISHLVGAGELDRAKTVLLRLLRMVLWLLGLVVSGFIVFNERFVTLWVGSHLFAGSSVNLIISLSLVFVIFMSVLSNLCFSLGNIKGNSVAATAQGLLSVPLMIVGAQYWGMVGVALAPLLAMLAVSAWYYPYAFSRLLKLERADIIVFTHETVYVIIASTIATGFFFWITITETWISFVLTVVAFSAVYTLIISLLSQKFRVEITLFLRGMRFS